MKDFHLLVAGVIVAAVMYFLLGKVAAVVALCSTIGILTMNQAERRGKKKKKKKKKQAKQAKQAKDADRG